MRHAASGLPAALLLVLLALVACGADGEGPSASTGPAANPGTDAAAGAPGGWPPSLGEGFVVWESNRSGAWRLWRRDLAGGDPVQLTPETPGFDHCCAQIAPGGERVAYLRFPTGGRGYPGDGRVGELRWIGAAEADDLPLAEASRTYHEHRAVVWLDDASLVRIGADHRSRRLEVATGAETVLTVEPKASGGWLLDPTLSWAVDGLARFSPYDADARRVAERAPLGGCQAVFSGDGRWGLWIAGAGGPIRRLDLASGATRDLVRKSDARLPDGLGYLYFPMPSRDGRLLAFAASDGDHDHFSADYEVFVAETDPETLELIGPPVRITRDPATDRFPDAWLAPLALGQARGEAPLTARFEVAGAGADEGWSWDLGDGRRAEGPVLEATWERAGRWPLSASGPRGTLRGLVVVAPAAPPEPQRVALAEGGRRIDVTFDEPVSARGVEASLASGLELRVDGTTEDGRTLLLRPSDALTRFDRLTLDGVRDRAAPANRMPATILEIEPPVWPSNRDDLLLEWRTAGAPNTVAAPGGGPDRATTLEARGRARVDRHGALVVGEGVFVADDASSAAVVAGARAANELSLALVAHGSGRDGVLVASGVAGLENFVLEVRGGRLVFSVRVKARGPGSLQRAALAPLDAADGPRHVAVSYTPGRTLLYLDGRPAAESGEITGDFFPWRERTLALGARPDGEEPWSGNLEGIGVWGRVLTPGEAAEDASRYRRLLATRSAVERTVVLAERGAGSRVPTLDEITPYRRALAVVEYRVESRIEGEAPGRIRVALWAIQDGETLPSARLRAGSRERLVLESFAAQEQLEAVFVSDTLEPAPGVPLYYAVEAEVVGGG